MPRRRTPLERAIAAASDRKVKFEERQKGKGRKRVAWWVAADAVPHLKAIVDRVNDANGERALILEQLAEFVSAIRR